MNIKNTIFEEIKKALLHIGIKDTCDIHVHKTTKDVFGDYQVDGIIAIAKKINLQPLIFAKNIVKLLNLDLIAKKIEIVNPGFINIFLHTNWIENQLTLNFLSNRFGISKVSPKTIVVDYSSPNVAKEMHIGHMRSTIIGDASVRTLRFLGHKVIKANHIGDWGTQFGMLIAYLKINNNTIDSKISSIEKFYLAAKKNYDENKDFAKLARYYVVKLHNGDPYCKKIWKKLVNITKKQNQKIYDLLDVSLKHKDIMGESLYHNMIPYIISDLKEKGLAVESKGALVVYLEEFKNKDGNPMGVIIQKKDGAYLYTTVDIACIKYRYERFKADRIIYYIDSRQHQHLMQVYTIAKKANYIPESVSIEHHMFGMILNKEGKPFKTRYGRNIKLKELLKESIKHAKELIIMKNPLIKGLKLQKLAKIIGIGAVKYADLSKNRVTNYVFDWNRILNFDGNTSLYIQYAYTRINSMFRGNKHYKKNIIFKRFYLREDPEIKLAICLLQLEETIFIVANSGQPHILCNYLYKLSVLFSTFYESCPIIRAKSIKIKFSRLKLSLLVARTIKFGLNLLGIRTTRTM